MSENATTRAVRAVRQRLREGGVVNGIFCKTTAPEFIECIGHAGFDFCILDMEHSPVGLETLQNLIRAAEVSGVLPIVRTRDACEGSIAAPLDLGAAGIQVPQVAERETAEAVVRAARQVMGDMVRRPHTGRGPQQLRGAGHQRRMGAARLDLAVDRDDPKDPLMQRVPQLYNFYAVAYESIMLGAFETHHGPENPDCMAAGLPKITEIMFAYSRDGFHWSRPDRHGRTHRAR